MKLIPIDLDPDAPRILYALLGERDEYVNISHKVMPTFGDHCSFVRMHPFQAWYLIEVNGEDVVGQIYLTLLNEIGVQIHRKFQRMGYADLAVDLLRERHGPRRYLANVAPGNEPSRKLWIKKGFKHIQDTFACQ